MRHRSIILKSLFRMLSWELDAFRRAMAAMPYETDTAPHRNQLVEKHNDLIRRIAAAIDFVSEEHDDEN